MERKNGGKYLGSSYFEKAKMNIYKKNNSP
jgi:hypothetical protein